MSRPLKTIILVASCLLATLTLKVAFGYKRPPTPKAAGVAYQAGLEKSLFRVTNEVRRKKGSPALAWDTVLVGVARAHSADMLARNYFAHVSPDGHSLKDRVVPAYRSPLSKIGENIWSSSGRDFSDTHTLARIIVENWMSSPGHRRNLLDPDFTAIGIGVAYRGQDLRVTQVLVRSPR